MDRILNSVVAPCGLVSLGPDPHLIPYRGPEEVEMSVSRTPHTSPFSVFLSVLACLFSMQTSVAATRNSLLLSLLGTWGLLTWGELMS